MHAQHQHGGERTNAGQRRQAASGFRSDRLHAMNGKASVSLVGRLCRCSKRLIRFLAATVDYDAGARVDDFALLNEYRVNLWLSMRIELKAGEPSRTLEMIDRAHAGDFQVAERGLIWENGVDVVGDDALVVRLRQVRRRPERSALDELGRRAAAQHRGQRQAVNAQAAVLLSATRNCGLPHRVTLQETPARARGESR